MPYAYRVSTVDGATGGIISGDVAIQSDLDLDGDLRITGKATLGPYNTNTGSLAFVAGSNNTASGLHSTVSGGCSNHASGERSTVSGGNSNWATGDHSTIGGGLANLASDYYSTLAGGLGDTANHPYSTVGGGWHNKANGNYSTVAGGFDNGAKGYYSAVAGGDRNRAGGEHSYVGGGFADSAAGPYSTIGGGYHNVATGDYSTVAGGYGNSVSGNYSFAGGYRATAAYRGTFIWADKSGESFESTDPNQFLIRASGGVGIGTNDPSRQLTVRGNILIESASTGDPVVELGEGLDYAEGFDVSDHKQIAPGAVLVIDSNNPGKLRMSDRPYDSRVAGIVAGANGMGSGVRLGADQFDWDVALAGRVYCKVDASYGAVSPGELLTTSPNPGYAMLVKDYTRAQGAILGKAMQSLSEGEKGEILVLVTLQ